MKESIVLEKIGNYLVSYDDIDVKLYLSYITNLANEKDKNGKLKNWWIGKPSEKDYANLFKKVKKDGIIIDGDTVTLSYFKGLKATYNYQAYKNLVLKRYPESVFDIQNVYEGDDYSFKKESGKVIYTHSINDPFKTGKKIIGCYCVIKNSKGEFLEILNVDDIEKMRKTAKTDNIWKAWYSEMILKSVIKRACKRHFKDIIKNAESIDNENSDPDNVLIPVDIKENIEKATTTEDLSLIFESYKDDNDVDKKQLIKLLSNRKKELQND